MLTTFTFTKPDDKDEDNNKKATRHNTCLQMLPNKNVSDTLSDDTEIEYWRNERLRERAATETEV